MMNLIIILAFSVLVSPCILCEANVSENKNKSNPSSWNANQPLPRPHSKKLNSSRSLSLHGIVKREISADTNDIQYPYYKVPTEMMVKRTAAGLNKFIYVLRNSFDKSAVAPMENDVTSKFPAALVERRGQTQKDRKVYLRCYFNAVSCFKK